MSLPIAHIPNEPGVYLFKSASGEILYIGKAKNLFKRVQQYFSPGSVWKQEMVSRAAKIDFITVTNESESLYLEDNLIKQYKPAFNSLLKGDNTYIFVRITHEEFPQVLFTRKRKADGSIYIGPKRSTRTLKNILRHIRRYLQYRGCKNKQFKEGKLCSDYFRGLCQGWCVFDQLKSQSQKAEGLIAEGKKLGLEITQSHDAYQTKYTELMQLLEETLDGNPKKLLQRIHDDIQQCITVENFERAAQLKEVYQGLESYYETQSVVLDHRITAKITKIIKIANWYVLILLHFNEGKIIDVIRNKIKVEDTDIHELLVLAEQEAGTAITVKYKSATVRKKLSGSGEYHDQGSLDTISEHIAHGVVVYPEQGKHIHANLSDIDSIIQTSLDSYIISSSFESDNVMNGLLDSLQQRYFLKEYPYQVECLDISHFGGKQASGGLSCIQGGIPHKYGYRRYKIHSTDQGDDYKALREVVIRRFKLQESKTTPEAGSQYPQLFILDGGKAQLGVVIELINEYPILTEIMKQTQFASLEKGKARKRSSRGANSEVLHVLLDDGNIVSKKLIYDKVDQLLVKLRDEAHRFANQYRKKQASKERQS